MKKKLSISDIARSLNISVTTVSFILNGRAEEKRISEELVQRVQKYIAEVGYKPNSLARSLRTGKSNTIGLMVEDISNPFFANIARMIEDNAYKNGYKILYCSTDNDTEKTKDLIQMFQERHVDGYIIAPPDGVEEEINTLISSGSPVVLFDRNLPGVHTDYVGIDNYGSTYHAINYLIRKGYKNIAFITLYSLQSQMQERMQGYESALAEHQMNQHIKEIPYSNDPDDIIKHVSAFLSRKKEVDAVLFGTNYLAVSGLRAIYNLGLKIPSDLAVIAFDDHDVFELSNPSITAIKQPIQEISGEVINLLLKGLKSPSKLKKPESLILKTTLELRKSSK
ncbi:LacI family transcriptional regulator [Arcticibacter tournemirensis]|uniref:LacI family transcriptional regulator n=1 Tax=Arcticibacter tournemirensis TaxID=699437 RepID=A0A5M9GR17_9SPHI|nr:substrate-binding domain-containing protein [Arcticibacter tournemirensis]KAA8477192.1 LacI family transcriptional regulator [Arcticibacter tournemirensis]TQM50187.1 LacI family transcriptional regulator [Arcticibacter tournemirensis]